MQEMAVQGWFAGIIARKLRVARWYRIYAATTEFQEVRREALTQARRALYLAREFNARRAEHKQRWGV